jgi:hypothetical protein
MGLNFGLFNGFNLAVNMQMFNTGGLGIGSIGGFDLDGILSGILG